jgi:hypothetical protein
MDHTAYEEKSIWQPLLMQLGCNFLTQSNWVNIISHSHDKVGDSNGKLFTGQSIHGMFHRCLQSFPLTEPD